MPTPVLMPASTSFCDGLEPLARVRGRRLRLAPDVVVERRDREGDRDVRAAGGLDEDVDVADDHRAARDDAERVAGLGERLEAGAGQAVAALGGLVGVGRGADRDDLALPRGARELAAEDLGDVDLDADRRAVAVVGRPVGALLEGADVTERAAVDAAHVGVERPVEAHALDAVQGAAARLFAVLGGHVTIIRTYVRTDRRNGALLAQTRANSTDTLKAGGGWTLIPTQGGGVGRFLTYTQRRSPLDNDHPPSTRAPESGA